MTQKSFQDHYPDALAHCYGCGRLNEHGHQIKSYWDGDESVCHFVPKPYHISVPGYVYGGLLASLIDCHATGSAAAAMYKKENREMDTEPSFRFLTGSLFVKYLKPTPINCTLQIRGRIKEITGKKVIVALNMDDEAQKEGIKIDEKQLSAILGVPCIKTSASAKTGIEELKAAIIKVHAAKETGAKVIYSDPIEEEIAVIVNFLKEKKRIFTRDYVSRCHIIRYWISCCSEDTVRSHA
mgnify:CR=1 FL=1